MNYLTVILSRPKVTLVFCLNKLGGDSHSIRFAPHTALQDVLDLKFTADLVHWLPAVLVLHDGSAGDHTQVIWIKIAQLRDHLLREAVTEVVLACVAGEVLEREHGQHQPAVFWLSGGRGAVPQQ